MCGIAGVLNLSGHPVEDPELATRMASALVHRGPDEGGFLKDGPLAFGFRRLSIIDVDGGHQPVPNETQTIWTMLNGEIYNFLELRNELQQRGHHFQTNSDTEVIVHAYETHGLDFVQHLRGMFAIAIWDSQKGSRFGPRSYRKKAIILEPMQRSAGFCVRNQGHALLAKSRSNIKC